MQNTTNKTGKETVGTPNQYLELIIKFPPKKINSEEELEATQQIIDSLLDQKNLTKDERDYLHLLGLLVSEYEDEHYPIPDIYGVDLLKVLIAEKQLSNEDIIFIFENEQNLQNILNNKQSITLNQIQKLADFFHISPSLFCQEKSIKI